MSDSPDLAEMMPLAGLLGIETLAVGPDEIRLRLPWSPERCTSAGIMHGGAIMALADTAGGWLASLNLPPGAPSARPPQAVSIRAAFSSPSSATLISRISTLRTLPVTVIGNSPTIRTYRGILWWAIRPSQNARTAAASSGAAPGRIRIHAISSSP
jgi:uncharacterized protein (TIGR00369 family)